MLTGDNERTAAAIQQQAKQFPWAQRFAESAGFVMVAGSSWPKDEDILLEHFNNHPEMKLIIAPHEIHEEHVQSIIGKLKRPYMRYTQMVFIVTDRWRISEADSVWAFTIRSRLPYMVSL